MVSAFERFYVCSNGQGVCGLPDYTAGGKCKAKPMIAMYGAISLAMKRHTPGDPDLLQVSQCTRNLHSGAN